MIKKDDPEIKNNIEDIQENLANINENINLLAVAITDKSGNIDSALNKVDDAATLPDDKEAISEKISRKETKDDTVEKITDNEEVTLLARINVEPDVKTGKLKFSVPDAGDRLSGGQPLRGSHRRLRPLDRLYPASPDRPVHDPGIPG